MSNAGSSAGGGDIFDVKRVRRFVELMKEHDLAEVDLRQGDQRIRLRRGAEPVVTAMPAVSSAGAGAAPTTSAAKAAAPAN